MFRNRRTSQKPSDELYKCFKDNFPELGQALSTSVTAPGASALHGPDLPQRPASADNALDVPTHIKDSEPTPRPNDPAEQWPFTSSGLTPSFMDPHTGAFSMFAQLPGYYTPTPNGTGTLYHSQAGDLHTPTLGGALGTPLSLPTSEGILHASQHHAFHNAQPHLAQHFQQFHNLNPFQGHHDPHVQHHQQHDQQQQQQSFAPHHFTHQNRFDHLDQGLDDSPMADLSVDVDLQHSQNASPELLMHPHSFTKPQPMLSRHPSGEKFRWHATLNAPTAMIKNTEEIPITYLNKGQAYTLNVVDTHAQPHGGMYRYRTFVRISFEDEQQRQRPAACWQLWKEGRGTNEAHQRGGRLQAVEYVPPTTSSLDDSSKPRMELESASFDSFCVLWTPAAGSNECPISVRFNFLSTDFSHSKGVKGIPVRLCAKTSIVQGDRASPSEVCYCKVKLFRDHGAERKLSNDVAHVKKSIDKLNTQIQQLDNGMPGSGKRKRSNSIAKGGLEHGRPGKVLKHRRTWSMSSVTSSSARGGAEDDLHMKLMTLQDMFTSTRPASVLYLKGAEEDDPDIHPVQIAGEAMPVQDLKRIDSVESATWEQSSTQTAPSSSLVSPSPSHHSLVGSHRDSTMQQPTPFGGPSRVNSSDWRAQPQSAVSDIPRVNLQLATPLETQPIKIQTRSPSTGWVEAVGVDHSYQPPEARAIRPVACFYVQPRHPGQLEPEKYHRAIYLMSRTLKDFVTSIAMKCNIEPTKVIRTVHYNKMGLQILFDDECIRELAEGQTLVADFVETTETREKPVREWDLADIQVDGDLPAIENVQSSGYELKLIY